MHNIIGAFDKYNFAHSKLLTFVIIILSTFHFTSLKGIFKSNFRIRYYGLKTNKRFINRKI